MVVLAVLMAVLVVAGLVAAAAGGRGPASGRRGGKANAAEVRMRNEQRAYERDVRFGVPAPRQSREDSGYWLVDH